MDEIIKLQEIANIGTEQLSLIATMVNFFMCIGMAFIVKAFYQRFSYSLTGKMHIASVMPILAGVIFLVIVIVKSSLALSLGLVGALSIVRFRTPIKEPEELVYLFLVIAIGLGYGAGYSMITTIIILSLLFIIYIALSNKKSIKTNEYNIAVDWNSSNFTFDLLVEVISKYTNSVKLIRLDNKKEISTAVLIITFDNNVNLDELTNNLKLKDSDMSIRFFESKTNW